MSEQHKCTEECIGQLEDIVARLQEEHQEDLRRTQHLEETLRKARYLMYVSSADEAYLVIDAALASLREPSEAPEQEEE